jgi:hypothetical protein
MTRTWRRWLRDLLIACAAAVLLLASGVLPAVHGL